MRADAEKPLLGDEGQRPIQRDIEKSIEENRNALKDSGQMALGHLVYAALEHASAAISHPDQTLEKGIATYRNKTNDQWLDEAKSVLTQVWLWARRNPIKVSFMVIGLGISAFKAKVMGQYMLNIASSFCAWSRRQPLYLRFFGFVGLMSVRLIVSTLVPPTSPGFGIIIQAATPDDQKWTAMPCFLFASAIAGAWPYILDQFIWMFSRKDFGFTILAKHFADHYPLTCWTGPAMKEAFDRVYQSGGGDHAESEQEKLKYGKLGASFAVIVGHVVPFMGAQTTIMQRFFLPHPLDTIVSQPFGMTEDLVSMAMAEATSDPVLASASLTALIVSFNLARGLIFTGHTADDHDADEHPCISSMEAAQPSLISSEEELGSKKVIHEQEVRDWVALSSACLNTLVGVVIGFLVAGSLSIRAAFLVVALQMMAQLLAVPIVMGRFILPEPHHVEHHVERIQTVANEFQKTLLLWLYNQIEQTEVSKEAPKTMSWSLCQRLAVAGFHASWSLCQRLAAAGFRAERTWWRSE